MYAFLNCNRHHNKLICWSNVLAGEKNIIWNVGWRHWADRNESENFESSHPSRSRSSHNLSDLTLLWEKRKFKKKWWLHLKPLTDIWMSSHSSLAPPSITCITVRKVNPKQRSKRMLWEEVIYAHKEIQDFAQLDPKGMAHTKYTQVGGIP